MKTYVDRMQVINMKGIMEQIKVGDFIKSLFFCRYSDIYQVLEIDRNTLIAKKFSRKYDEILLIDFCRIATDKEISAAIAKRIQSV
jgi:hypothetical protein